MVALAQTLQQSRVNFPNDYDYTMQALVEELTLIERHARDESWKLCGCIPSKHLPIISGLSSEAYGFSDSDEERWFMQSLMTEARLMKRDIDRGVIRSDKHFDEIRAWAREARKRIERKKWSGAYSTDIEYKENEIPQSVLQFVEDLDGLGLERENPLSLPDIEEEMAHKMVAHLCDKYNVPMPKRIVFTDSCNPLVPNAAHIQRDQVTTAGVKNRADLDELVFCKGGVTAFAVAHEFEHYRSHFDGNLVADEGKANEFAIKEVRNHLYTHEMRKYLYTPLDCRNIDIQPIENNLLGKSMSIKITTAQRNKGLTAVAGLASAKVIDYFDPQLTAALGPLGTTVGKIAVGALAAYYGLTKMSGLAQDFLLFGGAELALSEVWKYIPGMGTARAVVIAPGGPVAVPLTPGGAEAYPGASSTIRAGATFMRTFSTPTRLTAGYPQVARADGKYIQIRV